MEVQLYLDKKSIYCYSTSTFTTMPSTSLWKDLVAKSQKGFHFFVLELTWSVESKKCILAYCHLYTSKRQFAIFCEKKYIKETRIVWLIKKLLSIYNTYVHQKKIEILVWIFFSGFVSGIFFLLHKKNHDFVKDIFVQKNIQFVFGFFRWT